MDRPTLYADEDPQVKTYSSIDQFRDYVSAWKQGGPAPIVFDQLDYIGECSGVHSHPAVVTFGESNFIYPEGRCTYVSDRFVYVDENGVEYKQLPECFGGQGELYPTFIDANAFINFDDGTSLGLHQAQTLRVGLSYAKANDSLPPAD